MGADSVAAVLSTLKASDVVGRSLEQGRLLPQTEVLLSAEELQSELQRLRAGQPVNGVAFTPQGGAVLVQPTQAFRARVLDENCAKLLLMQDSATLQRFLRSNAALRESQDIANLQAMASAATDLGNSVLKPCLTPASADRLQTLSSACAEWAAARERVAQLLHRRSMRQAQAQRLRRELELLGQVLHMEDSAIAHAARIEQAHAVQKLPALMTLLQRTAADLHALQESRNQLRDSRS
jgi:murein L,D-transpeptidase YcbB/YkuD